METKNLAENHFNKAMLLILKTERMEENLSQPESHLLLKINI